MLRDLNLNYQKYLQQTLRASIKFPSSTSRITPEATPTKLQPPQSS